MKRGILLSLDFVAASAVLVIAIGLIAHTYEISLAGQLQNAGANVNGAATVAELLLKQGPFPAPSQGYCLTYSNGTNTCTQECPSNTQVAQRIVNCEGAPEGFCTVRVTRCEEG